MEPWAEQGGFLCLPGPEEGQAALLEEGQPWAEVRAKAHDQQLQLCMRRAHNRRADVRAGTGMLTKPWEGTGEGVAPCWQDLGVLSA